MDPNKLDLSGNAHLARQIVGQLRKADDLAEAGERVASFVLRWDAAMTEGDLHDRGAILRGHN